MQRIPLNQSLQIELDKLPSIPHALLELLKVIRDTDVSFTKISEIIQTDPALTTRVMSIANAPGRYQWSQYKDFNRLIVALGLKMVKFIAINSSVQQFFSKFNVDDQRVLARFWQTSLTTASLARALAHITGYVNEDEAYIAGLLHKLGELVCLTHNTDDYVLRIKELQADISDKSLLDIEFQQTTLEQEFVGASIPEIGAWIINGFDRDTLLGDAILFQREAADVIINDSFGNIITLPVGQNNEPAGQWLLYTVEIDIVNETALLAVDVDGVTSGLMLVDIDISTSGNLRLQKLLRAGILDLKTITIEAKTDLASNIYFDQFSIESVSYRQHTLILEEAALTLGRAQLAALVLGDSSDSIVKEINDETAAGKAALEVFSKQ